MDSRKAICDPAALAAIKGANPDSATLVVRRHPMRIPGHFAALIRTHDDPLGLQAVPSISELLCDGEDDPLCEEAQSPVPNLVHRYPDRVLFLVENRCALYCRHCMRKRRTGATGPVAPVILDRGIGYIKENPAVREVVLSGGDPLMMDRDSLLGLLGELRKIPHLKALRIHTRVPGADPARVTEKLVSGLGRFSPLFVNIQFNHPAELTDEAREATRRLARAGIQLGSQSVLLRGVNDDSETLASLFTGLLGMGIRPYCLHHPDPVAGTGHFSVPLSRGLELAASLRGRISGMAVPHYMLDLPGGFGKTALLPGSVEILGNGSYRIRCFQGIWRDYRDRVSPA